MIIKEETIKKITDLGYTVWGCAENQMITTPNDITYKEAVKLVIGDENFKFKTIKAPKNKEVTIDWVMDKLNKDSVYVNLQKYLLKAFQNSIYIYVASYGIGVCNIFGEYKYGAEIVQKKLNDLGIKYRTEFSDAMWVYRFIISKDSENMEILKSL